MLISKNYVTRILIFIGVFLWFLLFFTDLSRAIALSTGFEELHLSELVSDTLLILFILDVFAIFFIDSYEKSGSNFIEHLWKSFVISSICLLFLLAGRFFLFLLGDTYLRTNFIITHVIYHINLAFFIILLGSLYFLFRKMVLFQKSRKLVIINKIFETAGIFCLALTYLKLKFNDKFFFVIYFPMFLFSAYMTIHLKWVAYLKFRQKLNTIILMILILGIIVTYLEYFYRISQQSFLTDITGNIFLAVVSSFLLLYLGVSCLVLFFNLPTSSVFEKKFDEVINFQRLSQVIQIGQDEAQVYEILFEGSKATLNAKAGWLEIFDANGNIISFLSHQIDKNKSIKIKMVLRKNEIVLFEKTNYIKDFTSLKYLDHELTGYKSLVILPLQTLTQKLGIICFVSDVKDGFDHEMIQVLETYVAQASINIHNSRLVNEAIKNERFKESAKIAMGIQKRLLPSIKPHKEKFDIHTYCKMAEEIGGDYYDFFSYTEKKHVIVIGDVSGKGTNAAFQMALMKGIFQTLVYLTQEPLEFAVKTNQALSYCLEKNAFVTAIFGILDEEKMTFKYVRAGHCPIIHYSKKNNTVEVLNSRGLGLGILRQPNLKNLWEEKEIFLDSGDILLLFTDGIIETKNTRRFNFGIENLVKLITENCALEPVDLMNKIIQEVKLFSEKSKMDDDSTLIIFKIK